MNKGSLCREYAPLIPWSLTSGVAAVRDAIRILDVGSALRKSPWRGQSHLLKSALKHIGTAIVWGCALRCVGSFEVVQSRQQRPKWE